MPTSKRPTDPEHTSYEFRAGVTFPSWRGINQEQEFSALPDNQLREIINARPYRGGWRSRGGQSRVYASAVVIGTIRGIYDSRLYSGIGVPVNSGSIYTTGCTPVDGYTDPTAAKLCWFGLNPCTSANRAVYHYSGKQSPPIQRIDWNVVANTNTTVPIHVYSGDSVDGDQVMVARGPTPVELDPDGNVSPFHTYWGFGLDLSPVPLFSYRTATPGASLPGASGTTSKMVYDEDNGIWYWAFWTGTPTNQMDLLSFDGTTVSTVGNLVAAGGIQYDYRLVMYHEKLIVIEAFNKLYSGANRNYQYATWDGTTLSALTAFPAVTNTHMYSCNAVCVYNDVLYIMGGHWNAATPSTTFESTAYSWDGTTMSAIAAATNSYTVVDTTIKTLVEADSRAESFGYVAAVAFNEWMYYAQDDWESTSAFRTKIGRFDGTTWTTGHKNLATDIQTLATSYGHGTVAKPRIMDLQVFEGYLHAIVTYDGANNTAGETPHYIGIMRAPGRDTTGTWVGTAAIELHRRTNAVTNSVYMVLSEHSYPKYPCTFLVR